MRPALCVAALAATVSVAVPAGAAMDVATFLAKAEALRAKGFRALFSSDLGVVRTEAKAASQTFQAEKARRAKAGEPPISCPPHDAKLGAYEFLDELKKIPVAERTMPLSTGMAWVSRHRYPCR